MTITQLTERVEALKARVAERRKAATAADEASPQQSTLDLLPTPQDRLTVPQRPATKPRPGRPPKPLLAELTERQADLFRVGQECIAAPARQEDSIGFLTSALIYAIFPHSELKDGDGKRGFWKRRNGQLSISIQNDPDIGLPYGKLARLIVAWLCTEAKRTRSREIILGRSQAEFLRKLGLKNTGGKNGDIGRLNEQAKRLFTSSITVIGQTDEQFRWHKVEISSEGMLLWSPHKADERSRWNSMLTLGERFFEDCVEHSVPFDIRVIHALRSPLAIDIYIWLTYRFRTVGKPTPVPWPRLHEQFGCGYPDTKQGAYDFKCQFRRQLANVKAIYHDANVIESAAALTLLPSKPHVPY